MPFARPCLKCKQLTRAGSYCQGCRPKPVDSAERKEKKKLLYGGKYAKRSKLVRQTATHCHICTKPFEPGDRIEADHLLPGNPDSPLAAAHRLCNQKRGNKPLA